MMKNRFYTIYAFLIIFFGLIYSCLTAYNYIERYDVLKNVNENLTNTYFFKKEGGTPTFWYEANKIKEDIVIKSFFASGNKYEFKYLPSRLVYLYYYLINEEIIIQDNLTKEKVFKTNNGKLGLIIIQNILYFFSLFYLYKTLHNKYSDQNIFAIYSILLFLSFEPTINQWNRVLYSESIFFSIQIITLSILIGYNKDSSYKEIIFIGVLLSLMYLQRTLSIYYFVFVVLYFYLFFKKKFIINILILLTIYSITHIYLGFCNYNRDGKFYFIPILAKEDMYGYFIPKIIKYHKDRDFVSKFETRHDKLNNFVYNNNLNSENEINIEDRLKIADQNFEESLNLIIDYPLASLKEYGYSILHYALLKPNELHYLFENNIKYKGKFYQSLEFQNEKILKIAYSIIVYIISIIGLLDLMINKEKKIIFILICSILYFSLPTVWHKQSSYLAPVLIYISFFFGFGVAKIFEKIKLKMYV
ncbi:hypothetical protein HIMB5_00005080 [alpha proteobacterium HIMB5]|nr:hypothetical protein HIMB5_00005080 [alpha proteobacterium HIMB5]